MSRPQRAFQKRLRPIGQAILGADIEPLVRDCWRRIKENRRSRQYGTYVLADSEGNVYVLVDGASTTENIVRREISMLVGLYAAHAVIPEVEQIRVDLITHFFRVGFLTPGMIYDAVAREP